MDVQSTQAETRLPKISYPVSYTNLSNVHEYPDFEDS